MELWEDLVDTLPDVRYLLEVLCCTIVTHLSDLEILVKDFNSYSGIALSCDSLYHVILTFI